MVAGEPARMAPISANWRERRPCLRALRLPLGCAGAGAAATAGRSAIGNRRSVRMAADWR